MDRMINRSMKDYWDLMGLSMNPRRIFRDHQWIYEGLIGTLQDSMGFHGIIKRSTKDWDFKGLSMNQ